jgi:predicted kinase
MPDNNFPPGGIAEQMQNNGGFTLPKISDYTGTTPGSGSTPSDYYNQMLEKLQSAPAPQHGIDRVTPVSPFQVDTSGRYPKQLIGADNEDLYAQGQTWYNKLGNDTVKMLGLASGTFLQGTLGAIIGVGEMIGQGKGSAFYDNDFNQAINQWTQNLENKLPNYYTARERDGHWYEPSNLFTANFLFDKVMKNLGFALGAAASGGAWGLAFKGIGLTTGLVRAGQSMELAGALEEGLAAVPAASRPAKALEILSGFKNNALQLTGQALQKSDRFIASAMGTLGEASIESLNNLNEYRSKRIQSFIATHGYNPTGADLEAINRDSESVGNATFGMNAALLTVSNYIQFPRILNSSYKVDKALVNGVETQALRQSAEGVVSSALPQAGFKKLLYQSGNIASLFFNPTEGFEEIAQEAASQGAQAYYNRKRQGQDVSVFKDMFLAGADKANSENGWEQFMIGALSGGLMTSGIMPTAHIPGLKEVFGGESKIKERGFTGYGGERAHATGEAITALNKHNFQTALEDRLASVERSQVAQERRTAALRQGDILESKDEEYNYLHEYLSSRIKYGKFDFVKQDIDTARQQAATQEGFEQLQAEGKAAPTDTREAYLQRISNLETHAQHVRSLYDSLNLRYGGLVHKETGEKVYTPEVIDKMVYAASKIADYDRRIPQLSSALLSHGISVQEVINAVTGKTSLDTEAIRRSVARIDTLDILSEQKDQLRQDLQDVAELSLRRKSFLSEYEDIKKAPKKYEAVKEITPQPTASGDKQTITVKTKDGEEELEIGTEYYLGRVTDLSKEGKEVYRFPKLTILGKNEDGTIQIKTSNGQVRNIKPEELASYKLGKVSDTQNNKKAAFYLEHINDIFEFNFGKGKKVKGRLQMSPKKGTLKFVYKNEKGQIRSIEVTGDQFVPRKGFDQPMIQKVGTLTAQQQKTLEDFAKEKDARIDEKRAARFAVIEELVNEAGERIEQINQKLADNTEAIKKTEEELESLSKKIEEGSLTQKKQFKSATRTAVKAANRLSNLKHDLEQENTALQAEKDDLEMNLAHFYDMAQNIDELPTDSHEFLEELKSLTADVEDAILNTGLQINNISRILGNVERALKSAMDLVWELLDKFEKAYPKAPNSVAGQAYVDFIQSNPNFLKLNPFFKEDLKKVEEIVSQVEDLDITPNERTIKELKGQLEPLQQQLAELEKQYKVKRAILDKFEQKAKQFKKEQALKAKLANDTKAHNALFKAQEETPEPPINPPGTQDTKADIESRGKAKPLPVVFTSTISPNRESDPDFENKPHLLREERFKNNLGMGRIEGRNEVEALVVHAGNEAAYGLTGLSAKYTNQSATPGEEPILYVYIRRTADGAYFVDEEGKPITKVREQADLSTVVFSYAPSTNLENKKYYTNQDSASVEAYQKAWAAKRAEFLASNGTDIISTVPIENTSRGHVQKNQKEQGEYSERNPITDTLVTSQQLDREQVLFVATDTERRKVTVGGQEINLSPGTPYIHVGDTLEFANNRHLTPAEAETIYKVILQLSKVWEKEGKLDKTLTDWLQSVVYWYAPSEKNSNVHTHQVYIKDGKLHIGKNDTQVFFNPETLADNKDLLLTFLSGNTAGKGTFHHVSNRALNKFGEKYLEITDIYDNGEVKTREWPSYQHYLTSTTFPDGSKREAIPVTTNVRKTTSQKDSNIQGRYVKMAIDLGVKKEEAPAPVQPIAPAPKEEKKQEASATPVVADGQTANTFTTASGEKVLFTTDGKSYQPVQTPENLAVYNQLIDKWEKTLLSEVPGIIDYASWPQEKRTAVSQKAIQDATNLIHGAFFKYIQANMPKEEVKEEVITPAESTLSLKEQIEQELAKENQNTSAIPNATDEYSRVTETALPYTQDDMEKVKAWFKQNLPQVPVQRVEHLLRTTDGGLAWGKFGKAGVTLYEKAKQGTGYHEAFEAVYGLFLTDLEKQRLHFSFTRRNGSFLDVLTGQMVAYKDATPAQMKEKLADEFAEFVQGEEKLTENLKQSPAIVRFFKELWRSLKALFMNPEQSVFVNINKGHYSSFPVNMGRVLNDEYSRLPFDFQVQHELMQHITSQFMSYFFHKQNKVVNLADLNDGNSIPASAFYQKIREAILYGPSGYFTTAKALAESNPVAARNWFELAKNIRDNWDSIKEVNEQYLASLGIVKSRTVKEDAEDTTDEGSDENESSEDVTIAERQESRNQKDYDRDIFTIDTKENATAAIKLLFATLRQAKFSDNKGLNRIPNTEFVRSSIGGHQFIEFSKSFNTVLSELAHTGQLSQMLDKLAKKSEADPSLVDLIGKLGMDKTSGKLSYENLSYDDWRLLLDFFKTMSKQRPQAMLYFQKGGKSQLLPSNRFSAVELTKKRFVQNLKKSPLFVFDKAQKQYKTSPEFAKKISLNKPESYISFLKEIGLNTDSKGEPIMSVAQLLRLPENQRRYFEKAVGKVAEQMSKQAPIYTITGKSLQIETPLNTIASTIIAATSDDVESTFFNIMDEKVQSFVLNNPYSNFFSNFNSAADFAGFTLLERGLTGGYSRGSLVLKAGGEFFNTDGTRTDKKIEVGYIDGTITQKGPKQSSRLSLVQRSLQSFNLNLQGWFMPITNGDKKTEWMLSLGNPVSFKQIMAGTDGWNRIYNIFQNYLVAEIQTAQEDKFKNHAALKGKEGKLRFFLNILENAPKELHTAVEALIKENQSEAAIRFVVGEHLAAINTAVREYLEKETALTQDNLRRNGMLQALGENNYFEGLDEQFVYENINETGEPILTDKELDALMLFRTANQVINNIEVHKLFFGDPALMKDPIKRIPGAGGGVNQSIYDNQEFNKRFTDQGNRVNIQDGTSLSITQNDLGYMAVTDEVPILVYDEPKVQGKNDYEIYKEIEEADAQSKMSLPAYRELGIRTAEWTNQQEEHFQWEMANLRLRAEEKFGYVYSSKVLKAHDQELVKTYTYNGAVYPHIKPKGFSKNQDSNNVDWVYWKTAVKPLIPSAVIGQNDEQLMLHLMKNGIKVAAVPSAVKLGVKQTVPFYKDGKFNAEINPEAILRPGWKDVGIQVETQFSQGKKTGTFGSQMSKLSTMNLLEGGLPLDYLKDLSEEKRMQAWEALSEEEKRKASPLYDAVQENGEVLNALIENGYQEMLDRLSITEKDGKFIIQDYHKVIDFITSEARDMDDNTRAALQVDEVLGGLKTPLEAIPNYIAIKAVLYSLVDKSIAAPKVNGGGYVQSSSWGTEDASSDRTMMIGSEHLKWYTKEEPWMEIMLPFWAYEKLAARYKKMDKPVPTEQELLDMINGDDSILKNVGFRIPTQELNSAEVFKIKGFLPQVMGNTVVVPSEITKKVGSDFDVDKLSTYLKNLTVNRDGKIKAIPSFKSQEEARAYFENEFEEELRDKIARKEYYDNFRQNILAVFNAIENLQGDLSIKSLKKNLSEDLFDFYQYHATGKIPDIMEEAAEKGINPSTLIQEQMDRIELEKGKLNAALLDEERKVSYIQRHLRKSLENAYYDSLKRLLSLPENYDKLINPNDASAFKKIRNALNKALFTEEEIKHQNIETGDKNKPLQYTYLLSPTALDGIRHNLITGKYGIGIAAIAQTNNAVLQKLPVTLDMARMLLNPTAQRIINLGDGVLRFSHNTYKGKPTLSRIKTKSEKHIISRLISMFIDGFVDVAKDTFIMELGVDTRTAGTFLFMTRMGNDPEHTFYFMNQPIIREYLQKLDEGGFSGLYNKGVVKAIMDTWGTNQYENNEQLPSATQLLKNIEDWKKEGRSLGKMTANYTAEQASIFREFLKYQEMAQDLFDLVQGLTWDTSHMSDPEMFLLKDEKYRKANNTLFTPASEILNHTFIGTVKEKLHDSRDAIGSLIALEHPRVRRVLDAVKKKFVSGNFLPSEKAYAQVAKRVNNSFINYIIQVKGNYNKAILPLLVNEANGTAAQLQQALKNTPKDSPFYPILDRFEVVSTGEEANSVKAIQFKSRGKDVYTRNSYISGLRALQDGPDYLTKLYKNLVRHALIQNGVQLSPNSYSHLIPNEDYAKAIAPLIKNLPNEPGLEQFANTDAFFRNSWKGSTLPNISIKTGISERGSRWAQGFFLPKALQDTSKFQKGAITLQLHYQGEFVKYTPMNSDGPAGRYNPEDGKFYNAKQQYEQGSNLMDKTYLYKIVRDKNGEPLTYTEGNFTSYIYKAVSPWGMGQYAQEYYDTVRSSQIANNTFQPIREIEDSEIEIALGDTIKMDTNPQATETITALENQGIIKKDCKG